MLLPTLLELLQERYPDSSKTTLRTMLQNDRVRVNGTPERDAKRTVTPDDRIEVDSGDRGRLDRRVTILHEDRDLVVVHKDEGLLSVASPSEKAQTVESFLNAFYKAPAGESRVHVVHRLDRDTSGVLLFARNGYARDRLADLFARHDITRIYVAVVHGTMTEPAGTFRSLLAEQRDLRVRSVADAASGKEAITHYRMLASTGILSLLEVTLETGRRHQIRVHLAESGHPVVGDAMYGPNRTNPLGRLGLHARTLGFVHPRTGVPLSFTVEMPESFRVAVT